MLQNTPESIRDSVLGSFSQAMGHSLILGGVSWVSCPEFCPGLEVGPKLAELCWFFLMVFLYRALAPPQSPRLFVAVCPRMARTALPAAKANQSITECCHLTTCSKLRWQHEKELQVAQNPALAASCCQLQALCKEYSPFAIENLIWKWLYSPTIEHTFQWYSKVSIGQSMSRPRAATRPVGHRIETWREAMCAAMCLGLPSGHVPIEINYMEFNQPMAVPQRMSHQSD